MNVERPLELPLAAVVEAVRATPPVASAELVGLAPRAALEGFPADVPLPGFDPAAPTHSDRATPLRLLRPMAQTRRKRQTKHRGNAAGVVESRGRTGRKPTAAEKSGKARARRRASKRIDRARPAADVAGRVLSRDGRRGADAARQPAPARSKLQPGDRAVPDRAAVLHRRSATTPTCGCTTAACASKAKAQGARDGAQGAAPWRATRRAASTCARSPSARSRRTAYIVRADADAAQRGDRSTPARSPSGCSSASRRSA